MKPPRQNEVRNMKKLLINKFAMGIVSLNRMDEFVRKYEQARKDGNINSMDNFKRGYNEELREFLKEFEKMQEFVSVFCEIK